MRKKIFVYATIRFILSALSMITGILRREVNENKTQHIKTIMDWVYYQLSREDINL